MKPNEAPRAKARGFLERNTEWPRYIRTIHGAVLWPRMYKFIIVAILLTAVIAVSFAMPKVKYKSPDIVSTLNIPLYTLNWRGRDFSQKLNLKNEIYNFIGEIFSRAYENRYGENLLLLILNAGNFHNPKVCFGGSGFKAKDLADTEFKLKGRTFKAHTVYFEKGKEGLVVIYWICINKKQVDWTQQKILQLWYSLFNKEKIGLMVRLDIPSSSSATDSAVKLAQEFILDISSKTPPEQAEYLFGSVAP